MNTPIRFRNAVAWRRSGDEEWGERLNVMHGPGQEYTFLSVRPTQLDLRIERGGFGTRIHRGIGLKFDGSGRLTLHLAREER